MQHKAIKKTNSSFDTIESNTSSFVNANDNVFVFNSILKDLLSSKKKQRRCVFGQSFANSFKMRVIKKLP